jgi:hypothetical protein
MYQNQTWRDGRGKEMEWNGLLSSLGLGIRYRMDDGTRCWSSGLRSCKAMIAHKFKLKLKLKAHARHEISC